MILRLLKHGGIYFSFNIIQKLLSFMIVPVYTSYISPEGLGKFSSIQSLGAFFILLFTLGLDEAAALFYFKSIESEKKKFIGSILMLAFFLGILGVLFLYISKNLVYNRIIENLPINFFELSLILVFFSPFFNIYQKLLRIQSKAINHAILLSLYSIIQLILILLFVVIIGMKETGLLLAFSSTSLLFGIYSVVRLIQLSSFKLSFEQTKRILIYSKNVCINNLGSWGISNLMIVSIGKFASAKEVGLYTVISFFTLILTEFAKTFINVFQPFLYGLLSSKDKQYATVIFTKIFSTIVILMGLWLLVFANILFKVFFNEEYHEGINLIPMMIGIGVFNFLNLMIDQIFNYFEKASALLAYATIFGLIVNIVSIYSLSDNLNLTIAVNILIIVNLLILSVKLLMLNRIHNNFGITKFLGLNVIIFLLIVYSINFIPIIGFKAVIASFITAILVFMNQESFKYLLSK